MARKRQIKTVMLKAELKPRVDATDQRIRELLAWPRAISELLLPWQPVILRIVTTSFVIETAARIAAVIAKAMSN